MHTRDLHLSSYIYRSYISFLAHNTPLVNIYKPKIVKIYVLNILPICNKCYRFSLPKLLVNFFHMKKEEEGEGTIPLHKNRECKGGRGALLPKKKRQNKRVCLY